MTLLLGFEIVHPGNNTESEQESLTAAEMFSDIFGTIEHIAIKTNNVTRAAYYIEKKGYKLDWSTKRENKQGRIMVYLKSEIGGFAVELLQQ